MVTGAVRTAAPMRLLEWRAVTCEISCASTPASSSSEFKRHSSPRETYT